MANNGKSIPWTDDESCPCGSGKIYKNCCKKKKIKYYKKNDKEYIKSIPMDKEIEKLLKSCEKKFIKVFGRKPSKNDFVIFEALDYDFDKYTRKLKYDKSIPNDYVYAYDRTGLMVNDLNKDKLPDIEIEEFNLAVQEYNKLLNEQIKDNEANMLQVAEATNEYIKNLWEETSEEIIYVLNRCIRESQRVIGITKGFNIKDIKDFILYCIYKTIQNLRTLQTLINEGYVENSFAVVRFIYEILLNVIAFKNDKELFKNKILPLVGLDEGTFERKDNNTVIEKSTGKEYYCKIKISNLAKQAGTEYELLYNTLYYDLSGFIHVDTFTAKKIFAEMDNFLDIDECYVAGILSIIFSMEIIGELSDFVDMPKQLQKDLQFYINSKFETLLNALDVIQVLDNKEIYNIIKKTLQLYKF